MILLYSFILVIEVAVIFGKHSASVYLLVQVLNKITLNWIGIYCEQCNSGSRTFLVV